MGCGDLGGSWGMASWAVSAGGDAAEVAQQKSRKAGTWLAAAELVHPCNSIQLADVQQGCIEPCWCDLYTIQPPPAPSNLLQIRVREDQEAIAASPACVISLLGACC